MRRITTGDILKLLPENRALTLAKAIGIHEPTVDRVAAQVNRLNVDPRRLMEAMTLEELRSVCTHRGIAAGPGCSRSDLIEIALGGRPMCEVAYLPWWSDPNES